MSTKLGRFEIISQLAQSSWATVYKALDPENRHTIALKVVPLERARDASALIKDVFDEADQARALSSHNVATLYGVGDEDGKLLAASEYVEGNSIATALARKDNFSIWDLEDIARQVAQALDHAQSHQAIHRSLEPAKIMVEWEGTVKVLGFGISNMNARAADSSTVPEILHYTAPELLLGGEAVDHRAALFSLGAILYEMATGEKAFPGDTPAQVRTAILEGEPPLPHRRKANLSPGLSALIMTALSKSPETRYQSGRALVAELERSKAAAVQATPKAKKQTSAGAAAAHSSQPSLPQASMPQAAVPGAAATEKPVAAVPSAASRRELKVDPLMSAGTASSPAARSFSDISELPPLKDSDLSSQPSIDGPAAAAEPVPQPPAAEPTESKAVVRETAERALEQIRKIPPQLYLYALGGAVVVMTMIVGGIFLHNYFEEREQERPSASVPPVAPVRRPQKPPSPAPPPAPAASEEKAQEEQPVISEPPAESAPPEETLPKASGKQRRGARHTAVAAAAAQITISSSPSAADISFDGKLLCQSPCTLTDIPAGQHQVAATKPGYSPESRTLQLASGANAALSLELSPLAALLSVASTPAGAAIVIDGEDSGKLTPSEFTLAKPGAHKVLLRRAGYLEETSSIEAQPGQTARVNVSLTRLGSTDEIRAAGGKFKKLLGHGSSGDMGVVSVKTQPKGAQIMVNNRVLDKTTPFDFYLNPGTYVVDITMSGYRSVHRVINVEQLEKIAIEETLTPE